MERLFDVISSLSYLLMYHRDVSGLQWRRNSAFPSRSILTYLDISDKIYTDRTRKDRDSRIER